MLTGRPIAPPEPEPPTGEQVTAALAPPGVPASVHQPATEQLGRSITWLIGALTAVAATMVAGSQLSSIGRLSPQEDGFRLALAVGAIVVAVAIVVLTIGLLCWAQGAPVSNLDRLGRIAKDNRTRGRAAALKRYVAVDSSLHGGLGGLAEFLTAFEDVRSRYHQLDDQRYDLDLKLVNAVAEGKDELQARRDRVEGELEVVSKRLAKYRLVAARVSQLDKFLQTRSRYRYAVWSALLASALATPAFVLFAWAANPSTEPDEATGEAVEARSVAAQLMLTDAGVDRYAQQIGDDCAAASREGDGVAVVALSTTDTGVEVVLIPGGACPDPVRLTVRHAEGSVLGRTTAVAAD